MKFSIIIPLRKVNDYVREALPYYQSQSFKDFEIIIVSEEDETEKFYKTKIIKVGRVPPSEKRNQGVKNAKGEIIAFIDDDAYPDEHWLERADKIFKDKNVVALGGPSLVPKKSTFFQKVSSKVYELSSSKTGLRYGKGKKQEIDDWPTCNFFVKKKAFQRVNGFDTKYWGGEDTQLCYSLLETKKKILYDPEVVVYHHPRKTLAQHLKQTLFWGMWRGFFMRIHPKNSIQLTFFLPSLFILWLISGWVFSLVYPPFIKIYLIVFIIYLLFLLLTGLKSKSVLLFIPVSIVTFLTQIAYGIGFLIGISSSNPPIKKTLNPAEKLNIG